MGSHKVSCMFLVKTPRESQPNGRWLKGSRVQVNKEWAPSTLSSYRAALEAFWSYRDQKRRTGAYIFHFLNGRNQYLEWPKFFPEKVSRREEDFTLKKHTEGYKQPPIQQAPNSKYFICHTGSGVLIFLLPLIGQQLKAKWVLGMTAGGSA